MSWICHVVRGPFVGDASLCLLAILVPERDNRGRTDLSEARQASLGSRADLVYTGEDGGDHFYLEDPTLQDLLDASKNASP